MKRFNWIVLGASLLSAALGCAGGDGPPPTAPTDDEYDEIATAVGPLVTSGGTSGEVSVLLQSAAVARGNVPAWMNGPSSGQVGGQHLGVSYAHDVRCEDQAGVWMPCGPHAVRAEADASWIGSLSLPWFDASIHFGGGWTLDDLQGTEVILNGGSEAEMVTHFTGDDGVKRHFQLTWSSDYDVLRIDPETGRPVAGTATYDLDIRRAADQDARRFQVTAELTWSRSDDARLVLDGTRHYRLRTDSGEVVLDSRFHE